MKTNENYVLVTGATSGIGYELAKLFAKDNYNLVLVSRTEEDLQKTADELMQHYQVDVQTIAKDLFDPKAPFELYDAVKAKGLNVCILVNDAGQGQYGQFIETDIKKELDIIQLNVASLVTLTKLFLKDMVAKGKGKILNLSSMASKSPGPWQAVYHGTKAFVQSFTEAVREEVKESGVTLTALLPGITDTDFFNKAQMQDSKAVQDKDKMADPADVAKDGYEALMNGEDMVVSGAGNKFQAAMSGVTTDKKLASKMAKQQEPKNSK
jgi:short-subunit dehydrogenase